MATAFRSSSIPRNRGTDAGLFRHGTRSGGRTASSFLYPKHNVVRELRSEQARVRASAHRQPRGIEARQGRIERRLIIGLWKVAGYLAAYRLAGTGRIRFPTIGQIDTVVFSLNSQN